MKIYDFQCYLDWGNNTNIQVTYNVSSSSKLVNDVLEKVHHAGSYTDFETWTGLNEKDPAKFINLYFGEDVVTPYIHYYWVARSSDPSETTYKQDWDYINATYNTAKLNLTKVTNTTNSGQYYNITFLSGETVSTPNILLGQASLMGGIVTITARNPYYGNITDSVLRTNLTIEMFIFPDNVYIDNKPNPDYINVSKHVKGLMLKIDLQFDSYDPTICRGIRLSAYETDCWRFYCCHDLTNTMVVTHDSNNPYTASSVSAMGGADGTLNPGILDSVDKATIPELPAITACDLGFITMYNPSAAELRQLSQFMWSGAFDLATYKKLFADPMQSIIGLAVVPVNPSIGGSKNVMFGSIDSGISMSYLSSNWTQLDCGWVDIDKYIGSFMDYAPYTKISIYLPFIGIRDLSADDIMGGSIHVVYNIDVLTGACAAFVEHSSKGVLYSYNGSCITNIPLTSENFSGAIQNAVSAVISGIGTVAGMATGAAPITAMGVAGLMNSAANTALNSKPQIQRSGNLGGSAGILSILTPYVMIERPNVSVPDNVENFAGQCSNITMRLGSCKGFTMCEFVHLHDVAATSEEITEIEGMLKAGVIL